MSDVDAALTELVREHAPRVLALLAGRFKNLDLADDAVADALVEATTRWPTDGVPAVPAAWLNRVARRKAIDRLRRAESAERRALAAAPELAADPTDSATSRHDMIDSDAFFSNDHSTGDRSNNDRATNNRTSNNRTSNDHSTNDQTPPLDDDPALDERLAGDQLRLIFLCCHPALNSDAQVALTLRLIGGLTTDEIAAAYLVPTPTLAQRISRAKAKIRDAGIPLTMPSELTDRLDAVLTALYLIFNEGYLGRGEADAPMRVDLCEEALRLTATLTVLAPDEAEVHGLMALQLYHHARRQTRFDTSSRLVLLADQDRARWDHQAVTAGNTELHRAMTLRQPGRFQLQAIVASHHMAAASAEDTDWASIAALYDQLRAIDPTPVVALNHAVAVGLARDPGEGLTLLNTLEGLESYHLFHAAIAELHLLDDEPQQANGAFRRARELAKNPAEIAHLDQRIAALDDV